MEQSAPAKIAQCVGPRKERQNLIRDGGAPLGSTRVEAQEIDVTIFNQLRDDIDISCKIDIEGRKLADSTGGPSIAEYLFARASIEAR